MLLLKGEGDLLLIVFKESTSPLFFLTMFIEISLLSEMRKIKLLDREQIILDLSVSTYISLIHPLNRFPTLTQCETLKENTVVSFRDEDMKENKPCFPLFEKWLQ